MPRKTNRGINFTFHNAGQGLFYSGKIGDFKFIYDCGSKKTKHLDLVVKNYVKHNHPNLKLDLLILSHLHKDHISGLDELFNNGVTVDTVILPYLTPIERLMISLESTNLKKWFYQFWSDPVTFLIEKKKVNRVILVGGKEGYSPKDDAFEEEGYQGSERKLDIDEMPEDRQLRDKVRDEDWKLVKYFDKQLFTKNHRGNIIAKKFWIFRFFNFKLEDSKQKEFETKVRQITKNKNYSSMITNKPLLRKLKTYYEDLGGELNNTSLVVYHGPAFRIYINKLKLTHNDVFNSCFCSSPFCDIPEHDKNMGIGHFLTGDINLNLRWKEITKHYGKYFSKVSVVLVPHHGSKKNWNKSLLKQIKQTSIWVASAGITNRYRHPSFKVMKEIIQSGNIPYFCNELHGISVQVT